MPTSPETTEQAPELVACQAHVHAYMVKGHLLRIRCTDRRCPDVQRARASGHKAFHLFDVRHLERGVIRTEFEPDE